MKTICVPMASGPYGDAALFPNELAAAPFDWISTLTIPQRDELISLGFPGARTCVIPNGVDTDLFSPLPAW